MLMSGGGARYATAVRYRQDYAAGKMGKTVYGRSARNMPPHIPKKVLDREEVTRLRHQGKSYRQIAKVLGLEEGTVVRTLGDRSQCEMAAQNSACPVRPRPKTCQIQPCSQSRDSRSCLMPVVNSCRCCSPIWVACLGSELNRTSVQ